MLISSVSSTSNVFRSRGISTTDVDEDEIDSILIEELNNNSSDSDRESQIKGAIDVFRKYDLWKKAYEIHSEFDGNKNKWKFVVNILFQLTSKFLKLTLYRLSKLYKLEFFV